jgi:hypothetical protein
MSRYGPSLCLFFVQTSADGHVKGQISGYAPDGRLQTRRNLLAHGLSITEGHIAGRLSAGTDRNLLESCVYLGTATRAHNRAK